MRSALMLFLAALAWHALLPAAVGDSPPTPGPTLGQALYALVAQPPEARGPDWHREIGEVYLALGQTGPGLAYLRVAAAAADDPALWRSLGTAFLARGQWDAAREALEAVVRLAPQNAAAHYHLGVLLAPHNPHLASQHLALAADDPLLGEAARAIQEAIAATQSDGPVQQSVQVGLALAALDHWPQAEQAFEMAAALAPEYAEAWAYLALARARQGKDASAAIERALALAPENPLVLYLRGLALRALGDLAASLQALAEAQRLDPQNPAFAAELGTAYRLQGDLSLAEYWLQAALALAPGSSEFLTFLALFYAEETVNLDGEGLTVIQEAVALAPEDADLQAAYGWALYNIGQVAAAEEALSTALGLEPDNPRALYYRGLLYEVQGQHEDAIRLFVRLLDHPRPQGFDALARRILERLGYRP